MKEKQEDPTLDELDKIVVKAYEDYNKKFVCWLTDYILLHKNVGKHPEVVN